ncbi:MAG TPA: VWA domain-containing protein, partial [Candidatus Limnocylindrales bacterium]|nr:VWA domain-containing protein [Candidatus Limnocylindrales bacterium]
QHSDEMDIVERANRAAVTINTLDARGLYTPNVAGDASQRLSDTGLTAGLKVTYRLAEQQESAIVLEDFAYGTGGSFFHSSNDLAGGLKRAGEAPEVSYVLSFSPQNQRMDGKFHSIKVTLTTKQKYNIQARRGYFAPRKLDDPLAQAKQEIADAVFSQEEIQELPVDLQTQYFISSTNQRLLSVVSHIDVKGVPFRKADGRNLDDLTLATVIFDENGNYVTGSEKVLQMRLLDDTYAKMTQVGLVVKTSFDLKPGRYLIRQVVREAEGAQMAARNQPVFLPF